LLGFLETCACGTWLKRGQDVANCVANVAS
jgi:hypothetical protein